MWPNRPLLEEFCVFVLFPVCLLPRLASAYTKTYVMAEYCGDLIDLQYQQLSTLHLRLTDHEVYRPHMSCTFAVRAPPQHRLTMVVQWMDIAVGRFSSCADYLAVWDGAFNKTAHVQGLDSKLCGNRAPPSVTSAGRAMTLHFDSNTLEDGAGFYIVFTAFHEGACRTEEFTCDNGRCIDLRLKCDDYDNCGDYSDNCLLTVAEVVIAVIVTTIIFCLIVGAAVLYCHRDKLKIRKKCPVIGANPDGVYQPTTEPVKVSSTNEETTAV